MSLLRIYPYRNFSDNEHWVDGIDLLSFEIQDRIKAIFHGQFEDRGDRLEVSHAPSKQELAALSALCDEEGVEFISQIRSDEEWRRETGQEGSKKDSGTNGLKMR